MYIKTLNGQPVKYPYTLGDLKDDNPNTSFPAVISEEFLAECGVYPVTPIPAPTFDSKTQRVSQTACTQDGSGWIEVINTAVNESYGRDIAVWTQPGDGTATGTVTVTFEKNPTVGVQFSVKP